LNIGWGVDVDRNASVGMVVVEAVVAIAIDTGSKRKVSLEGEENESKEYQWASSAGLGCDSDRDGWRGVMEGLHENGDRKSMWMRGGGKDEEKGEGGFCIKRSDPAWLI
jgi:hypothetical protein